MGGGADEGKRMEKEFLDPMHLDDSDLELYPILAELGLHHDDE